MLQLQTLVVDIGNIAEGYKIPGQFVQIKVGGTRPSCQLYSFCTNMLNMP